MDLGEYRKAVADMGQRLVPSLDKQLIPFYTSIALEVEGWEDGLEEDV